MRPERPKLPNEAIELYNRYIHGEISRRDFLNGAKRFAVAGLTAGAIVEALMPNYVLAQQVSKTDDRIKASYETVPSPQGNGSIKGYFVVRSAPIREPLLRQSCPVFSSCTRIGASILTSRTLRGASLSTTSWPWRPMR